MATPEPHGAGPIDLGLDVAELRRSIIDRLNTSSGVAPDGASVRDWYRALAFSVRDRLMTRWLRSQRAYDQAGCKRVYYLSLEYLLGRSLSNAALCLDAHDEARQALLDMGVHMEEVATVEPDAGLGNGGLGRLAACYLDSLASLSMPGFGYGIRYDYGMFRQVFGADGEQIETPNNWLRFQHVWELPREERRYRVPFGGRVVVDSHADGSRRHRWVDTDDVMAVAYDMPIPGYDNGTVNHLRLWSAQSSAEFDLQLFNAGQHSAAMAEQNAAGQLSQVLYPDDTTEAGRELRLRQQYFFVAASLQDILSDFLATHDTLDTLPEKVAIQLNDTHPALAVPELMRICIDEHGYSWERAWEITNSVFAYTNHTLLPEALERWPVAMFERMFPRHLEIIYKINRRLLDAVAKRYPGDHDRMRRMSLIEEVGGRNVRMAALAVVGSHRVNGVAAIHTRIMRESVFAEYDQFYPDRFVNITNGITPRRWLALANPRLSELISRHVQGWENDLERLAGLVPLAEDAAFCEEFALVKQHNKTRLAAMIDEMVGIEVNVNSIFDVQIKRIHEYKRQLLNLLYVVTRYLRLRAEPGSDLPARTVIIAGKAAPAYVMARRILKLCNNVADVINADPVTRDRLQLVILPDYSVSAAEYIIPGAELSQQISTAGMEASGTGNMKLALNGALTIGTLDGANVEIRDAVGADNIFIFGHTAEEVARARLEGYYPSAIVRNNPELQQVLEMIAEGHFSASDSGQYSDMVEMLQRDGEHFQVLADYEAYVACQDRVDALYRDPAAWNRKAVLNVANIGYFSSDRSIREYASKIWNIQPVPAK